MEALSASILIPEASILGGLIKNWPNRLLYFHVTGKDKTDPLTDFWILSSFFSYFLSYDVSF
jgi:hypothetical protein